MRYVTKALPAAVLLVVAARAKTSRGRFSSESEWTRIDKAHGQPFPPDPNARFGIACGDVQSCKYTCGVSARTVKLDGQPELRSLLRRSFV
jgi:hypothetical protein